ncbi:MAG: SulP family sulfate permease, partial [Arenicella sp.]
NNRTLHLIHLSAECKKLLKKAGDMVEVNVIEDPSYFVAIENADWGDEPLVKG